ncbi:MULTISPECIES: hypothetical protein [Roseivirga]|jgi:hypothetical protein|nr:MULTISPECIES: hypothetical protein [Roseivirga]MBO6660723.1 hypothetical protein [Roseivirga sp.]MBO6761638.1 hypothetical protein [Roseivirga sp.]MBO6909293.1 hypothetical protein [Roseivirga sp.]WPZ12201.1 hypothetical protein T7867_08760 [Roseivirga spongicola]
MKRVILLSGILLMFFSASDMLAQRGRQDDRRRGDRKEDVRRDNRKGDDRRRDGRNNGYRDNDRKGRKDKYGRTVKVVDRRVYRNNGRRYNNRPVVVRNTRVYYDYDFRRGRRIKVNRGYRPSARHIWISGYWTYDRRLRRDVWVDGYWSVRRNNHRWVPGHYRRFNGVRIWIDGCWTIG